MKPNGIKYEFIRIFIQWEKIDFELTLNEIYKNNNYIKILVNKNEEIGLLNQNNFEYILIKKEKLDGIIKNNENIKETINGIKIIM